MLRIHTNNRPFYLECLDFWCSAGISKFLASFSEFSKIFKLGSNPKSGPGAKNPEIMITMDVRE